MLLEGRTKERRQHLILDENHAGLSGPPGSVQPWKARTLAYISDLSRRRDWEGVPSGSDTRGRIKALRRRTARCGTPATSAISATDDPECLPRTAAAKGVRQTALRESTQRRCKPRTHGEDAEEERKAEKGGEGGKKKKKKGSGTARNVCRVSLQCLPDAAVNGGMFHCRGIGTQRYSGRPH